MTNETLVERLRGRRFDDDCLAAADTIERLTAELAACREAFERIEYISSKPHADRGHRCEYRVQLEACNQSATAAIRSLKGQK